MVDWPRKVSIPFVPERLVQSAFKRSTEETVSAKKQRVPRRRRGIAWLLGFGVVVNYFDRVTAGDVRHFRGHVWLPVERLQLDLGRSSVAVGSFA